jgi:nucleotide-binding universal stress UspA family protein
MIEAREGWLRAQHARTNADGGAWQFAIHVGDHVDEITSYATHREASLVVLGLGSHSAVARLFHHETATRVIRAATMPVLVVPSDATGIPRSAIAAIDFTQPSEAAARAAARLIGDRATLYLAHATPRLGHGSGDSVLGRLDSVARRIETHADVKIELVSLHGDPAHELLAFAGQHGIEMIATGAHGRTTIGRLVLGSVSAKVIRGARCSVLIAPPHLVATHRLAPPAVPNVRSAS